MARSNTVLVCTFVWECLSILLRKLHTQCYYFAIFKGEVKGMFDCTNPSAPDPDSPNLCMFDCTNPDPESTDSDPVNPPPRDGFDGFISIVRLVSTQNSQYAYTRSRVYHNAYRYYGMSCSNAVAKALKRIIGCAHSIVSVRSK